MLADNHGNKVEYKMSLSFRCDYRPPGPKVVKSALKSDAITANITNITVNGNVTITFSKRLLIPNVNLTEFPSLNVPVQGKSVPALELQIISKEGKNLKE